MATQRGNGQRPAVAPLQEEFLRGLPLAADEAAGGSDSDDRLDGSPDAEASIGWNLSESTLSPSATHSIRPQSPELVEGLMNLLDREEAQGAGLGMPVLPPAHASTPSAAALPTAPFVPPLNLRGLRQDVPLAPAAQSPCALPAVGSPAGSRLRANALMPSEWRGVMERRLAALRLPPAAGAPEVSELGAMSPTARPGAAGRVRGAGVVPSLPLDPLPALSPATRGRVAQGAEASNPSQARGAVAGGSGGADPASGPSLPSIAGPARSSGRGLCGPS